MYFEVTKQRADERRVTRRALVLDHGFAAGHEQGYRRAMEATARELAAADVTHLSAFTSPATRTHGVLQELAVELEPYDFWAFDIPEPRSARTATTSTRCTSDMTALVAQARVDWFLDQVTSRGGALDERTIAENVVPSDDRNLEWFRGVLEWWSGALGPDFAVDTVDAVDDTSVRLFLTGANERRWEATITLEPDGPRRIETFRLQRRLPDGIEIRDAVPSDGPAIAPLYRATPIVAGALRVTIDPGDDYFATTRLMEESNTLVATEHDAVIGVYCGTLYAGRLNGEDVTITLGCHSRLAEGKAGGGVWSRMNNTLLDRFAGRFDVPLAFVLVGNAAASRLTSAGAWPAHPVRAVIPCDAAAASHGRAATIADADVIVEILNATYVGQDLFRPYTVSSLTARLERAPDLYSWDDVWIADGAVVGIGRVLQGRITEGEDGRRDTTRALVFDHGFLPGAEDRYRDLLAARGAAAAHAGASHLSVFTTEPSRTHPILLGLADSAEDYDVLVPGKEPADDAVTRGLYVDQIHF